MTDQIQLMGISARGHHGVLAQERREGQVFRVDITLEVDTRAAALSDDLDDTVDYSAVAGAVVTLIEGPPFHLIEALADRIASVCLEHAGVRQVVVSVHKPEAPVGVAFDDVVVRVCRP